MQPPARSQACSGNYVAGGDLSDGLLLDAALGGGAGAVGYGATTVAQYVDDTPRADAARFIDSPPSGGTVDFAHGTTTAGAGSITDDGLGEAAGAAVPAGGRYSRPGSFHTSGASPGNTERMQLTYEMALVHGDDACVVISRIPSSAYHDLVRQGHFIVEPIPGVSIPQTAFRPGAFPIINRTATWVGSIKPGG